MFLLSKDVIQYDNCPIFQHHHEWDSIELTTKRWDYKYEFITLGYLSFSRGAQKVILCNTSGTWSPPWGTLFLTCIFPQLWGNPVLSWREFFFLKWRLVLWTLGVCACGCVSLFVCFSSSRSLKKSTAFCIWIKVEFWLLWSIRLSRFDISGNESRTLTVPHS